MYSCRSGGERHSRQAGQLAEICLKRVEVRSNCGKPVRFKCFLDILQFRSTHVGNRKVNALGGFLRHVYFCPLAGDPINSGAVGSPGALISFRESTFWKVKKSIFTSSQRDWFSTYHTSSSN